MWRCLSKTVCEGAECHPPQPRPRSKRRKLMFEDGGGQLMAMDFEEFGSGDYGADQEDTQQRKIMPVLIRESAGHLRNATPWTDSSKAPPAQRLRKLWLLPASRLQLVRHFRRWSEAERCDVWHAVSNRRAACGLRLQMTRDSWNQQCRELAMLKAYQALTEELDRDLKKPTRYGCMEHDSSL